MAIEGEMIGFRKWRMKRERVEGGEEKGIKKDKQGREIGFLISSQWAFNSCFYFEGLREHALLPLWLHLSTT